jgi:hypothetical protein
MLTSAIFSEILLLASVLPEVEDPWPDRIGIGFLFEAAGAGGALMGFAQAHAPEAQRNRAIQCGALWGFRLGAFLYIVSLFAQVVSKA